MRFFDQAVITEISRKAAKVVLVIHIDGVGYFSNGPVWNADVDIRRLLSGNMPGNELKFNEQKATLEVGGYQFDVDNKNGEAATLFSAIGADSWYRREVTLYILGASSNWSSRQVIGKTAIKEPPNYYATLYWKFYCLELFSYVNDSIRAFEQSFAIKMPPIGFGALYTGDITLRDINIDDDFLTETTASFLLNPGLDSWSGGFPTNWTVIIDGYGSPSAITLTGVWVHQHRSKYKIEIPAEDHKLKTLEVYSQAYSLTLPSAPVDEYSLGLWELDLSKNVHSQARAGQKKFNAIIQHGKDENRAILARFLDENEEPGAWSNVLGAGDVGDIAPTIALQSPSVVFEAKEIPGTSGVNYEATVNVVVTGAATEVIIRATRQSDGKLFWEKPEVDFTSGSNNFSVTFSHKFKLKDSINFRCWAKNGDAKSSYVETGYLSPAAPSAIIKPSIAAWQGTQASSPSKLCVFLCDTLWMGEVANSSGAPGTFVNQRPSGNAYPSGLAGKYLIWKNLAYLISSTSGANMYVSGSPPVDSDSDFACASTRNLPISSLRTLKIAKSKASNPLPPGASGSVAHVYETFDLLTFTGDSFNDNETLMLQFDGSWGNLNNAPNWFARTLDCYSQKSDWALLGTTGGVGTPTPEIISITWNETGGPGYDIVINWNPSGWTFSRGDVYLGVYATSIPTPNPPDGNGKPFNPTFWGTNTLFSILSNPGSLPVTAHVTQYFDQASGTIKSFVTGQQIGCSATAILKSTAGTNPWGSFANPLAKDPVGSTIPAPYDYPYSTLTAVEGSMYSHWYWAQPHSCDRLRVWYKLLASAPRPPTSSTGDAGTGWIEAPSSPFTIHGGLSGLFVFLKSAIGVTEMTAVAAMRDSSSGNYGAFAITYYGSGGLLPAPELSRPTNYQLRVVWERNTEYDTIWRIIFISDSDPGTATPPNSPWYVYTIDYGENNRYIMDDTHWYTDYSIGVLPTSWVAVAWYASNSATSERLSNIGYSPRPY